MLINPFSAITFLKVSSLKATTLILFGLLLKSNLLRVKGALIGAFFALILISGLIVSSSVAIGSLIYANKLRREYKESKDLNVDDKIEAVNI